MGGIMKRRSMASDAKPRPNWAGMTDNEHKLLTYLYLAKAPAHLTEMQACVFGDMASGTSMARNTMRRLADTFQYTGMPYAVRVDAGKYKISALGKKSVPAPVRAALEQRERIQAAIQEAECVPMARAGQPRARTRRAPPRTRAGAQAGSLHQ